MLHRLTVFVVLSAISLALPRQASADGFALRFDGVSDLVRLGATASIMPAGWPSTKSVSLWVKPEGTPVCTAGGSCDLIFGDAPRTWGISRGVINGLNRIWIWNFDGSLDSVGISYTVGEWVHVAFVHGGGTLRAYKNGVLAGSVASGPTVVGGSTTLYVGGLISNATKNWTFQGDIDEVRLWSSALSASQVLQELDGPLTGSEPGLAAYYRMTDGSGTTLTDDSLANWTGTLLDGGTGVPADGPIVWISPGIFDEPVTPNTPPEATPQSQSLQEDDALPITLTGSDAEDDDLTFEVVTAPVHGTLSGAPPSVIYTPHANFFGIDSFSFIADDGRDESEPATVSLTVISVNDPPVAQQDTESTDVDLPVLVDVLDNDFDIDAGDTLVVLSVGDAFNGITSNEGTAVSYTPNPGFAGSDEFTYTVSDGHGGTDTALVSITVTLTGEGAGYALRFDGVSDYVRLAATNTILAPGWESTKTVSIWLRPTGEGVCTSQSPGNCDVVFGDAPRWWGISRGTVGGQNRIWLWNWDGNLDVIGVSYTSGEWMQVTMVHDAGVLRGYKNGVLVGTVASGPTQQPNSGAAPTLYIGGIINSVTRNWTFQGDIDEVRLWNTARSVAQIVDDMNHPLDGTESGLAAYYMMSDGEGNGLTDDSGNGADGVMLDGGKGVPADGPIQWVPSGAFE